MTDPVSPAARIELRRLAGRWHQLPLVQASPHVQIVRELAQRYADRAAGESGLPPRPLPDLGPAVVIDQLTVTVYDLYRLVPETASRGDATDQRPESQAMGEIAEELAGLRRRLG